MLSPTRRILVIDDDPLLLSVLATTLADEGYAVRAENDGRSVEEVAAQFHPDLALLDVRMGAGPDGYAVAAALRTTTDIPILFLTADDSLDGRLAGFDAGGDDYLAKPFAVEELLARTRALLRRSTHQGPTVWEVGDLKVNAATRTVTRAGHAVVLTPAEYELLAALGRSPGEVLSKSELLAKIRTGDRHGSNLVEVHVSALRRKLEAHGCRIVHTVRGAGYVLLD